MSDSGPRITDSGLSIEVLTAPASDAGKAQAGDLVWVHYVGTLTDGKKFDSSLDRGEPIDFTLGHGRVIKGWEEGVAGMQLGEKRKLIIPAALGYGAQAVGGGLIPANSTLVFEVELVGIRRGD